MRSHIDDQLLTASMEGRIEDVVKLLGAGANLEARDALGSALIYAAAWNHADIMKTLIAAGINTDFRCDDGTSALIFAAGWGHVNAVRVLLAAGVDIEQCDLAGNSALLLSVRHEHLNASVELICRGASIYKQNACGESAASMGHPEMRGLILYLKRTYQRFLDTRKPPSSTTEIYQLLATTPLVNPRQSVELRSNLLSIASHANWTDRLQLEKLLVELKSDGTINAETAENTLAATFPAPLSHSLLQPRRFGKENLHFGPTSEAVCKSSTEHL